MTARNITTPFPVFTGKDGTPIDAGYVYIGVENLEPVTNPIAVYWDEALAIPASQPIRTINGYLSRSGTPSELYSDVSYSIMVKDKNGVVVFSNLSVDNESDILRSELGSTSIISDGDALLGVEQPFAGAGPRTQHQKNTEYVTVTDFYANGTSGLMVDPTGVIDSTWGIQAAIDAVKAAGGTVRFPSGTYRITATLMVDTASYAKGVILQGEGRNTIINQTGAFDAIQFGTTQFLQNSGIRDLQIVCSAISGHAVNFVYGCTCCFFDNLEIVQNNPAKACFYGDWTSFGGGVYDTKFRGGSWYCATTSTEAGFRIIANGTIFNENVFENLRCYNSNTVQFFKITTVVTGTIWLLNNSWKNINFEVCKGGGIQYDAFKNCSFKNISFWDAGGAYTNHLIDMVAGTGYESIGNTFQNVGRNGDTLTAGVYDIRIVSGQETVLINCYTQNGDSPAYFLGGKRVTVIGKLLGSVVNTTAQIILNAIDGLTFPNTVNAVGLNYYDEGTFTATLSSATPPNTPPTTTARWTRVGRKVTVEGIFYQVDTTGGVGDTKITGLPFAAGLATVGTIGLSGIGVLPAVGTIAAAASQINITDAKDCLTSIAISAGASKTVYFSLTYTV